MLKIMIYDMAISIRYRCVVMLRLDCVVAQVCLGLANVQLICHSYMADI